ncbi:MAG TPA: hypothetical protein VN515_01165 [Terriglobales bacterium]|nr:hypothetical protein [Terriglobales bacterium]
MGFGILGCPHNHLSFPITTVERSPAAAAEQPRPHVTCLDCGREFWYDWQRMRRLAARPQNIYIPRRAA